MQNLLTKKQSGLIDKQFCQYIAYCELSLQKKRYTQTEGEINGKNWAMEMKRKLEQSDKIEFKTKAIIKGKKDIKNMIKGSIQQRRYNIYKHLCIQIVRNAKIYKTNINGFPITRN